MDIADHIRTKCADVFGRSAGAVEMKRIDEKPGVRVSNFPPDADSVGERAHRSERHEFHSGHNSKLGRSFAQSGVTGDEPRLIRISPRRHEA